MGRGEVLVKAMPWVPLLFIWVLAVCVLVILPVTVPWWQRGRSGGGDEGGEVTGGRRHRRSTDFETIFDFYARKYGMKAITISEFDKNRRIRSEFSRGGRVWQLPRKQAKKLLKDVDFSLSG